MFKVISKAAVILLVLAIAATPLLAQDAMEEKIVCDSALIVMLFVAEYEGYHTMESNANIEKGQYTEAFDVMMDMMMEDDMMEDDEMMDDGEMMEEGDDMMMDDMVTLELPTVAGEDPACTALRAELVDYFSGMIMDDDM